MGLALTKTVINRVEEMQGLRTTMDLAFGYHHFAHTHSQVLGAGTLGGQDAKSMVQGNMAREAEAGLKKEGGGA
jgi:enoyl-CoA hydratase